MAFDSGDGRLASGRPSSLSKSVSGSFRLRVFSSEGGVIDGPNEEVNDIAVDVVVVFDDDGSPDEVPG